MKHRYALFAGEDHREFGGFNDFQGVFGSIAAANEFFWNFAQDHPLHHWGHVIDLESVTLDRVDLPL